MMRKPAASPSAPPRRSVSIFAQGDVCAIAGLRLAPGAKRSWFEQDVWVLSDIVDAHRMVGARELVWDFTQIHNPPWRVVTKEILLSLMAPQHEAVLESAHALRTLRSPRTCYRLLEQFIAWFNWLTSEEITSLGEVTQELCERYLEMRHWSVPVPGKPRRRLDPDTMAEVARTLKIIAPYGELLSIDSYTAGFTPWPGKTAAEVVGRSPSGGENRTQPVPDLLMQPLLETCLYLVNVVGPQLVDVLAAMRANKTEYTELPTATMAHVPAVLDLFERMRATGEPLPAVPETQETRRRIRSGDDPLRRFAWGRVANMIGCSRFGPSPIKALRQPAVELAEVVGIEKSWAREAALVARANDGELMPWTAPLAEDDLEMMANYVATAALVVTAALTGMRTSELLELEAGCRHPRPTISAGGVRFRLAGRLIKGQKLGGAPDEWVVIEQVDRAIALVETLRGYEAGTALFGTIALGDRIENLRKWLERTGNRARWGLPAIPPGPVNARMLRRTLALAIAKRPGGLLAAKVALKHISVATTEGYTASPGGSQRLFLAEVQEAEDEHHTRLTVEAFRDFQAGRMPAGPGARGLVDAFHHVDSQLKDAARTDPKVLKDDRHLETLLRKLANSLHAGPANFCWFRDPAKALCLRLAGTPGAKKPLIGMCDSARCPQATHQPSHRPVWVGQIAVLDATFESPRTPKGEKIRLMPERDRCLRVVAEIDAASTAA